jgi:hypothetical protein
MTTVAMTMAGSGVHRRPEPSHMEGTSGHTRDMALVGSKEAEEQINGKVQVVSWEAEEVGRIISLGVLGLVDQTRISIIAHNKRSLGKMPSH